MYRENDETKHKETCWRNLRNNFWMGNMNFFYAHPVGCLLLVLEKFFIYFPQDEEKEEARR
jgi:hypothetical protein